MSTKKKRSASAIGRQNRARGGAYERFVAKQFAAVFSGARRGIGQARSGGDVPDVEGCGDFWVQCKATRSPNLFAALEQAEDEMNMRRLQSHAPCPYSTPMAVVRRTGKTGDVVALYLDHFVDFVEEQAYEVKGLLDIIKALREEIDSLRPAAAPPRGGDGARS